MNDINLPIPVKRALRKLGKDLCDARKKRRIPMWLASQRASISRTTLNKIEKGDGSVAIASYAKVIFILGMIPHFSDIADPKFDEIGLNLEIENLPKRIRLPKKEKRGL